MVKAIHTKPSVLGPCSLRARVARQPYVPSQKLRRPAGASAAACHAQTRTFITAQSDTQASGPTLEARESPSSSQAHLTQCYEAQSMAVKAAFMSRSCSSKGTNFRNGIR